MHIFYITDIFDDILVLNEEESRHCGKVLRLRKGDLIEIVDGRGGYFLAEILDPNYKKTRVKITKSSLNYNKRPYTLHIAIAPTKQIDRLEWFVEKAIEIGIDTITPILCEHSERRVVKTERLEKIAISAMKQSRQAYLPKINTLTPFNNVIRAADVRYKYIAHCYADIEKMSFQNYQKGENVFIAIGPEGDFSKREVEYALNNNCLSLTLGSNRLRTETAGVVACHSIRFLNDHDG